MPEPAKTAALIVAAGRGTRMGGDIPKQYQHLAGSTVLAHTVARFDAHPGIGLVLVVIHPDDRTRARACLPETVLTVSGGATRDASVAAGLRGLPHDIDHVLIHDGARPLLPGIVIDRVLSALEEASGAAPALSVTDALWKGEAGQVAGTVERAGLWRAQTPQGFDRHAIAAAHAARGPQSPPAADDVEVARAAGLTIAIVEGHEDNLKLTRPDDLIAAERLLANGTDRMRQPPDIRLGNGYDVHAFGPGDAVILCGVDVPHSHGLTGHSDADVGMHAVTDAIYGALAEGDIGRHFPPSDPQWKGAASEIFLRHAVGLASERGYVIANADCTLVCERPKIGPHADAMQARMAEIMGIDASRMSVKATTSERLGFTGREEGIAALATVALVAG